MRRILGLWLAICVAVGLIFAGCAPKAEQKQVQSIKIGVFGPMTYTQGQHSWYGASIAADEINKAGGVLVAGVKRPVELLKIETNELVNIADATVAIEKAITTDRVDFLVGGYRSEAALAIQDIAARYKKIVMFPPCGHPDVLKRVKENYDSYKYIFRVGGGCYTGMAMCANLVPIVVDAVKKELGIARPKIAILAAKVIWPEPFIAVVKKNAEQWGVEIVGEWRPSALASDLTAELTAIKAAGAHIIYPCMDGPQNVVFGKQYGELEIPAAVIGWQVETSDLKYWEATGGKANYEATASLYSRIKATERSIPFYDKFVQMSGGHSPTQSAATYTALWLLKGAIEQAGTLESDAVVSALENMQWAAPEGIVKFSTLAKPDQWGQVHEVLWGPGFASGFGVQWQDGNLVTFWPPADGSFGGVIYEGVGAYKLPPRMINYWKGK